MENKICDDDSCELHDLYVDLDFHTKIITVCDCYLEEFDYEEVY